MFPSNKILKDLAADVAGLYNGKDPGHDYTHIENLLRLVSCLAVEETIDVELLTLMCLFHGLWDATRKPQAEALLRAHGYTDGQIAILYQSIFAAAEERPESLEEALLHDANKLERLGAYGIARTWLITGHKGQDVASGLAYIQRNLVTTQQMYTERGQQLAAQRRQTVQDYLEAWVKEQV
jgi:uncharacterized protein